MSRSNPTDEIVNPCKHWFQFDSDQGRGLKKYNKELKQNEFTPMPFKFLTLDRLITTTGYNEPQAIGYYSNEVRNIKDRLTVRSKNGVEAEGTWEEVKAKLGSQGLDFCQSVYIAFYEGKTLTLGNIKMKGASLGKWFDFCKENKINEIGVNLEGATKNKKGKIEFFEPVFKSMKVTEATDKAAIDIDKELQTYLTAYLLRNNSPTVTDTKNEPAQNQAAETAAHEKRVDEIIETQAPTHDISQNDGLPF